MILLIDTNIILSTDEPEQEDMFVKFHTDRKQ